MYTSTNPQQPLQSCKVVPLRRNSSALTEMNIGHRLHFTMGSVAYRIDCREIIYCKSDSNYCHIIGRDKKYFICQTLKLVSRQLPLSQFIRVHHQYVVNAGCIISLDRHDWKLEIRTGEKIPVSRSHRAAVARLFHEY